MECIMCFKEIADAEAVYCSECTEGPFCEECAALHDCDEEPEFEEEGE